MCFGFMLSTLMWKKASDFLIMFWFYCSIIKCVLNYYLSLFEYYYLSSNEIYDYTVGHFLTNEWKLWKKYYTFDTFYPFYKI